MKIIANVLGMVSTNSYFVINESTGRCIIIDPEESADFLIEKCNKMQIKPVAILLTHGHFDHIGAVNGLKESLKIPVYAGAEEKEFLHDPSYNGSAKFGRTPVSVAVDICLRDSEIIEIAGFSIKVISTPGHTAGGVCYYFESEDVLFSGDVLFADSFGRTDFPGGSQKELADSIINKLFILPGETAVYPGHGHDTTIGYENANNPIKRVI
ncbi:MAG: MBL fold metallo-hydrolase [Oscillospiraceae bacterium]|jgi:glyoxylase-like metal-dependent hydrolase (beta-lactamase superfamily II)|nr:MBL fold metallo-hydrolase [Oscillospiraceae bacterium]